MSAPTPEQQRASAQQMSYARAVGELRGISIRLLWTPVMKNPEVLAEYVQRARECLAVIETVGAPKRQDVTLHPSRRPSNV